MKHCWVLLKSTEINSWEMLLLHIHCNLYGEFFFPQGGRGYVRYCRHLKHLLEERAALSLAFNRSKDNLDQR